VGRHFSPVAPAAPDKRVLPEPLGASEVLGAAEVASAEVWAEVWADVGRRPDPADSSFAAASLVFVASPEPALAAEPVLPAGAC
jgi:hypothetical protein